MHFLWHLRTCSSPPYLVRQFLDLKPRLERGPTVCKGLSWQTVRSLRKRGDISQGAFNQWTRSQNEDLLRENFGTTHTITEGAPQSHASYRPIWGGPRSSRIYPNWLPFLESVGGELLLREGRHRSSRGRNPSSAAGKIRILSKVWGNPPVSKDLRPHGPALAVGPRRFQAVITRCNAFWILVLRTRRNNSIGPRVLISEESMKDLVWIQSNFPSPVTEMFPQSRAPAVSHGRPQGVRIFDWGFLLQAIRGRSLRLCRVLTNTPIYVLGETTSLEQWGP